MNKFLIIQHEESTPPGSLLDWLQINKLPYEISYFSRNPLSYTKDLQGRPIIILGGGVNVDEVDLYPWLIEEKIFIKNCIDNDHKILGICLGAQLLAEALGGKVFKAEKAEIGWHPIKFLGFDLSLYAFHWHFYQFTLPDGAINLAKSEICPNQAFRYKNLLAFQFHPEANSNWVIEASKSPNLPTKDSFIQSQDELISGISKYQKNLESFFFKELSNFFL
jgi:GMP synthase-like glutamine amidotransferase